MILNRHQCNVIQTLINATKTFPMLLVIVVDTPIVMSTSEIAAKLNVLDFLVTFSKRWESAGVSRGVTAPLDKHFF